MMTKQNKRCHKVFWDFEGYCPARTREVWEKSPMAAALSIAKENGHKSVERIRPDDCWNQKGRLVLCVHVYTPRTEREYWYATPPYLRRVK